MESKFSGRRQTTGWARAVFEPPIFEVASRVCNLHWSKAFNIRKLQPHFMLPFNPSGLFINFLNAHIKLTNFKHRKFVVIAETTSTFSLCSHIPSIIQWRMLMHSASNVWMDCMLHAFAQSIASIIHISNEGTANQKTKIEIKNNIYFVSSHGDIISPISPLYSMERNIISTTKLLTIWMPSGICYISENHIRCTLYYVL